VNEWLDGSVRIEGGGVKKKHTCEKSTNDERDLLTLSRRFSADQVSKWRWKTSNSPSTRRTTRRAAIVPRSRSGSSRVSHAAHDARGLATRADGARAG